MLEPTRDELERSVKHWRRTAICFGLALVAVIYFAYNGDPLPFPNPVDADAGHGNYGTVDIQSFAEVNAALVIATGITQRYVIEEKNIAVGVYNTPQFTLTSVSASKQKQGLTGTGPSFQVDNPRWVANEFKSQMEAYGKYTATVHENFMPDKPEKFFVVTVVDKNTGASPLLGWAPAFRVRTTSMGLPKFSSFAEFFRSHGIPHI